MSFFRGSTTPKRFRPRHGLDFTLATRCLSTDPTIKLKNSKYIDDSNTGRVIYGGLETNIISLLKGTVAEFGFPHNIETATEQAAALCKVVDGTADSINLAVSGGGAGYTANYQLLPDTEAVGDYVMFGGAAPFGAIWTDVSATVATYSADSITWEYYTTAGWTALTIIWDQTDSDDQDGDRPFQEDGYTIFSAPTDWAASGGVYWIRARVTAAGLTQIPLLDSVEHSLLTIPGATEVPIAGTIGRGRASWTTVSGANNDTECILMNITSGACSAITTLTQALAEHEVADFALAVARDDKIAMFYTQEDGTTEFANGALELRIVGS